VHHGITCDGCQMSPITGLRFKCRVCPDYDLCEACEAKNGHPADHPLIKFKVEKMRQGHGGLHRGRHPFHALFPEALRARHPLHALPEALRGPFSLHGLFGEGWRGHNGGHRRWLNRGSVGEGVKEIQKALKIEVDGFFGAKTEQAVKEFQAANSLDVDGIVGPRTRAKLLKVDQPEKKEPAPEEQESAPLDRLASWWLARGSVGDAVKEMQRALGLQADGFFGPKTEQAVKDFQTAHSLDADGIVGPRTRAALNPSTTGSPALEQLTSMGFSDANLNARLLQKHKGDVDQVIAELLS